jgi:hypothetical protein
MPERKPLLFKRRDVERAALAASSAGLKVNCIEIAPDGRISLKVDEAEAEPTPVKASTWED